MTREHRDAVLEQAPRQLRRTFTLVEAARLVSDFGAREIPDLAALRPQLPSNEPVDVPDPIGQDADVFRSVGSMIAELMPPLMELCRHSASPPQAP